MVEVGILRLSQKLTRIFEWPLQNVLQTILPPMILLAAQLCQL